MTQIFSSCQWFCILLVIFSNSNAAKINLKSGETCASVCSGKENIFQFEEGKIYSYNFLSRHTVQNPNSDEQKIQLELKGRADVSRVSSCDFSLQLADVILKESTIGKGSDTKNYDMMKTMLEKFSLRFGFDDGRVVGVCPDNNDKRFAVNVKKALLSSLQISLDALDAPNYLTETDISGDCITEYTTVPEPPSFVVIKKIKSISGCARKNNYFSTLSGKIFEEPMENRNFALLDGSYNCEIKVKKAEGLKESICKEIQTFKPFASEKSGSSIVIEQELRFDSLKPGKISSPTPNTREDLVMNHGNKTPRTVKNEKEPAIEIAKQLCITMKTDDASTKRTSLFVKFIRSLTMAKYNSIQDIDKYFEENVQCSPNKLKLKNILLDALPYVKTHDAFKFLVEDSKVYKFKKLGFSFIENASPDLIETFTKKLDDPTISNHVSLTLTSMIKSFCEKTPGCMLNPVVIKAMNILSKTLNDCNYESQLTRERILFTLRAIGNAGDFPDYNKLIRALEICINSHTSDDDIKAFSIEVVRQFPCNDDIDKFLWTIYDGVSLTSETRIQAYLSLIRCPSRDTFRKIIQKLNSENSQQLGSFVWSHISNLMETSDRFKTELREMLQIFTKPMENLSKKFNLDFRSYSKNIEKTFHRGYSSAKIDSNIIFSSSPLPSSITANITIDAFGRSINILEFGIRGNTGEKLFNLFLKPHENPHADVIKMDRKNEKKPSRRNLLMYYKVMGREIYFTPNILSDLSKIAKKFTSESYEKSLLLLDTTVSISSITGFPIELTVESAVSADLKWKTNPKMTLKDFSLFTKNNVAIQIIGKLQVNAHCTTIGIQSLGTASSDTEFEGIFKYKPTSKDNIDTSISDYQFEVKKMPDDRKLISISNEMSLIHDLSTSEINRKSKVVFDKCTGDSMLELRGIKLCGTIISGSTYGTFFPNFEANLLLNKFNGFKFLLQKENTLKPFNKLTRFLTSISFQGNDKETFKFQINRNSKAKKQEYELSLWNKDIYFKFDINDKKISGKLKYGQNEAEISGSTETKKVFVSTINLKIKTKSDELILFFENAFTKEGPQITLTGYMKGDKEFSLQSKTSMKISKHKLFNYFHRFRHSTILKVSGDNTFSLILESSKGNTPVMEMKAKIESYWKTKSQDNFNIKQNFVWTGFSVIDTKELFEKIPGTNYSISLDQKLQVKDKKFDLRHNFHYFISNGFSIFGEKPSLIALKLESYDVIKQKFIRQLNSKLLLDLMSTNKGKVILKNFINHPALNLYQKLKALVMWKRNSLDMYDIEAEISESDLFKILFKHKFTTTQNGVSSLEIKSKKLIFKVNSELMLPKHHILTISWPDRTLVITSKVDAKSLMPFNTVISHDIELDKKLIATIINTAEYNVQKTKFQFKSVGKKSDNIIYSVDFGGQLKHNFTSNKIFYDFLTNTEIKVPSKKIDVFLESKQFSDIELGSSINTEKKVFESKFFYKNKKNDETYGYETIAKNGKGPESFLEIKNKIYKGLSSDECTLKFLMKDTKSVFGLSINSDKYINFEYLFKMTRENGKISANLLATLDLKNNDKFNFYYKNNVVFIYQFKESYSISWQREYGKSKNSPLNSSQGSLTIYYRNSEKLAINLEFTHPLLSKFKLIKVMFGFNVEVEKLEKIKTLITSNTIVKWRKENSRTSNYYELKLKGNHNFNQANEMVFDIEGLLTKDSSLKKLLELAANIKKTSRSFESNFKFTQSAKYASLTLNLNLNDFKNHLFLFSIKSSSAILKEITVSSDLRNTGKTFQGTSKLIFDSTNLYKIEIVQIRKLDFSKGLDIVSNVKWMSNIPYLSSGSYVLGILVHKVENFQINFNLNYKNAKKLDIKFSMDTKSKQIRALAESYIITPLKFTLYATMPSNEQISGSIEFGYKESFLKIQKIKLYWQNDESKRSSEFSMTILSSNEDFNDIILSSNSYYEVDKFFTTFKRDIAINYKGKPIHTVQIDLLAGTIKFESLIGQYTKNWKFNNLKLDLKYHFNSIRDMSVKYKFYADPVFEKSEFEFIYFRQQSGEQVKNIESFGEASFFCKLQYKYKGIYLKKIIFINKDISKGSAVYQVNFPKFNLAQDELFLDLVIEKVSDSIYQGKASFKTTQYQFKFESFGIRKKSLEINALSKNVVPESILISYDFQENVILKIKVDQIFNADVNIKPEPNGKKSGTVELSLKGEEILNLKLSSDVQLPKDVKTITDYLKAIIGIRKGIHIRYNINGKIYKKMIKRDVEIYHLKSKKFLGGYKSFYKSDTLITGDSTIIHKIMFSFDRNFPKFDIENKILFKIDDEIKLDRSLKLKFVSKDDFLLDSSSNVKNQLKANLIVIYNVNIIQVNYLLDIPSKNLRYGFGFRKLKNINNFGLNLVYSQINYTLETNIVNLIYNSMKSDYFPIGQEYFVDVMKKYEVRIYRKKSMEFDVSLNYDWAQPIKVSIELTKFNEKKMTMNLKGTTPFEKVKQFSWKLEYENKQSNFDYSSSLRVNKKTISELVLIYTLSTDKLPHMLKIDYKGYHSIKGNIKLDTKNYQFSHSITTKDGTFKTLLWTSKSKCEIKSKIDCYINHINSAREVIIGINLESNFKRMELTWNKNKGHSLIISITKKDKLINVSLQNPIKIITLTRFKEITDGVQTGFWNFDVKSVDKSTDKDISVKLEYKIKGSLRSDYNLELNLKSNIIRKGIKLTVKRDVSLDIGDLYAVEIKANFDDEKRQFFGIKGYIRQLSSRSYEIKLHCTNYEKFATFTTTFIFASEEITLEYKLIQSNQPTREFVIQYIPFRKFLITNKKDFTILLSRVKYQYGYRGDYVIKLGSSGTNLVAYSTYTRSPLKYYAEIKTQDQKIVLHIRNVGESIFGELYRKTPVKKILDSSLKISTDSKNILTSRLYWDPKIFDRMKTLSDTIFNPQNLKTLMIQAYQNSENHLSNFMSNIQLDIVKNINVVVSLEFMKGIANEMENFPKNIATSYENDDYFMKTIMSKLTTVMSQLDISTKFNKWQSSMAELKSAISKKIYESVVDARLYAVIYKPLSNSLNSFTYEDVKSGIKNLVNVGKCIFTAFTNVVNKIGDILDTISEKAKFTLKMSENIKEKMEYIYKNSFLMDMFSLLSEIKDEILNILANVMNTDVVRQRIRYYQDTIRNSEEIINVIQDFKNKVFQYFKTSNLISNVLEMTRLIRSMKYKEAFLNLFKIDETRFKMNLDEASIELKFYNSPLSKKYIKIMKTLINWLPIEALYQARKSSLGEKLLQLYYRYEYLMFNYGSVNINTLKKLFPPFPKTAWVINGNSILSFDGNSVRIGSGKCSYLLARDFNTKSFSLVMNINSETNEKEFELSYIKKISIFQSGLIKVNGEIVNILPKLFKEPLQNFVIYRDNDMIKVKTSEGLLLKYFYKLDTFKVKVAGNWHGHIKGLLGSNDFEAVNDWSTPNGLITHDAGILAKSWSLGACDQKIKTGMNAIKVNQHELQQCVNLFHPDSESYLKRCYYLINPEPYFELCHRSLQYSSKMKKDFKEMLCNLSRNYVMRCKAKGIMIRLDKACVKCGKSKLNSKVSVNDLSKRRKFNYIFIMEQSKCLLPYEKLIQNLANIMGLKSDNMFTLLSYNGKYFFNEVHFKSIDNKINTNKEGFSKLLSEFWSFEQINDITKGTTSQPGQAIYEAIKMSSMPGYTEKIILVGCSACAENEKYIYSLLAGLLSNAGISVTYLTNQTLTGADANSNTVGLGNKLVYFFEPDSDSIKSRPWKRNVQAPKDSCSPLARLEQGFVWSLKPLDSDNKMRRLAEVIHVELEKSNESAIQTCYCTAGNNDDGSVECKVPKSRRLNSMLF